MQSSKKPSFPGFITLLLALLLVESRLATRKVWQGLQWDLCFVQSQQCCAGHVSKPRTCVYSRCLCVTTTPCPLPPVPFL